MKKSIVVLALALLLTVGAVFAQKPAGKISGKRHPNLAAAQRFVAQALVRTTAAQKANEFDLDGHAKKAKELLEEANKELMLATKASNENR
jgi:hypothetical protein